MKKKLIDGWPGYAVTDDGRVLTCWRRVGVKGVKHGNKFVMTDDWRELRGGLDRDGYVKLILCHRGRRRYVRRSRLILETFAGPAPKPGMVVRHVLTNVRTDDRVENLAWGTQKQNCADKRSHGTAQRGERSGTAKLTSVQVRNIRRRRRLGETPYQLADRYGVGRHVIYSVLSGKTWGHLT